MNKMTFRKVKAFTFTEVLITMIIVGILVLLALPSLMPLITSAKSTEAQMQLDHLYTLEKNYFYMYSKYSSSLDEIGYEAAKSSKEGGNANYKIEITEASDRTFRARASAIVDFDGDGTFNVWEIDQEKKLKEVTKD